MFQNHTMTREMLLISLAATFMSMSPLAGLLALIH